MKHAIDDKSYHKFLISESWLKDTSRLNVDGFTLYGADRNTRGSSLCIYLKSCTENDMFITNQTL